MTADVLDLRLLFAVPLAVSLAVILCAALYLVKR